MCIEHAYWGGEKSYKLTTLLEVFVKAYAIVAFLRDSSATSRLKLELME